MGEGWRGSEVWWGCSNRCGSFEWKWLLGVVVLLVGGGSIVVDGMGWMAENGHALQGGHGAALTRWGVHLA